ncbi:hypothetical protein [Bacillus sp. BP-3]|nr:hypothetical protein [Bacillus sp. BP-3]
MGNSTKDKDASTMFGIPIVPVGANSSPFSNQFSYLLTLFKSP